MSFGWSAGDIATAVTLLYNIIEALDDVDGAAENYREAMGFLRDLKRTLEPLQTLTAWNAYPTYANEIAKQVQYIRGPVDEFLNTAVEYELSLGAKAKKGLYRHVGKKLQWYLLKENKVSALKNKIGDHMRILDTLICRLILDVVLLTQEKLPGQLRAACIEVLPSELVSHLRDNLVPLRADVLASEKSQKQHHHEMVDKFSEYYTGLSSDLQTLKEDLRNSTIVQQRIASCLSSASCRRNPGPRNPPGFKHVGIGVKVDSRQQSWPPDTNSDESDWQPNGRESQAWDQNNAVEQVGKNVGEESLRDVYYLALLYVGHFLKNLFLALSRLIEPPRALMPVLLAKYNISFLDAIGSPPRILPYEYFRNFKVLQTFIQVEFKSLPGSTWVNRGLYRLLATQYNRPLAEDNWSRLVTPGTTITMAMLIRKTVDTVEDSTVYRCPEKRCKGTWPYPKEVTWVECPVCQKKVLTTTSSTIDVQNEEDLLEDSGSKSDSDSNNPRGMQLVGASGQKRNKVDRWGLPSNRLHGLQSGKEGNLDLDDIEIEAFRRILEIHSSLEQAPASPTSPKPPSASKHRPGGSSTRPPKTSDSGRQKSSPGDHRARDRPESSSTRPLKTSDGGLQKIEGDLDQASASRPLAAKYFEQTRTEMWNALSNRAARQAALYEGNGEQLGGRLGLGH